MRFWSILHEKSQSINIHAHLSSGFRCLNLKICSELSLKLLLCVCEQQSLRFAIGPVKQNFERKIAIIFLHSNLSICFGAQKNHLIETVLLSTHNICFG